jgi:hypothetical protein
MRAVYVPVGQHEVEFRYWPQSLSLGLLMAGAGILGMFILALFLRLQAKKN